jgi:hypothetical protein
MVNVPLPLLITLKPLPALKFSTAASRQLTGQAERDAWFARAALDPERAVDRQPTKAEGDARCLRVELDL